MKQTLKTRQKEESRIRILEAATKLFKEKGYEATGVDELMEEAGLTAGAFYAHFKSKSHLLGESIRFGIEVNKRRVAHGVESKSGIELINQYLGNYVSELHRDRPDKGCVLPTVGSEIYRNSKEAQASVTDYLDYWVGVFTENLPGTSREKKEKAYQLVSQAVGAILLSRIVSSEEMSKEILKACNHV